MIINFIRHGLTEGNKYKKYIGSTDEPLCSEGIDLLRQKKYPRCQLLAVSPMKRCIQTGKIIYPEAEFIICEDFRECNFGVFEGKNYKELEDDYDYQKWIDSNGSGTFPNGENPENFKERCIKEFEKVTEKYRNFNDISLIVHGGTIMSVMEKYVIPKKNYYDFSIENGGGYITEFDGSQLKILDKI